MKKKYMYNLINNNNLSYFLYKFNDIFAYIIKSLEYYSQLLVGTKSLFCFFMLQEYKLIKLI